MNATRPITGPLSCVHATTPGGRVPGWEQAATPSLTRWGLLLEDAPLSSYRYGDEVRAWIYTETLEAQVVVNARLDPGELAAHSWRTGAATTLVTWGDVPQKVFQR